MVVIPSGNIGEVSCAQASSEELSLVAIKCFYREISLLEDKSVQPQQLTLVVKLISKAVGSRA